MLLSEDIQPEMDASPGDRGISRTLDGKRMVARPARYDEFEAVFALGCRFQAEATIPYPPLDRARSWRSWGIAIHVPEKLHVLVADAGDHLAGFMVVTMLDRVFSTDIVARHDILYVAPEHRGGRAAILLVRAFEAWARANGAGRAIISTESGINPERTARFYGRLGFAHLGGQFGKDL